MKKILIITYYWPPGTGPGVYRWLQMTKYLVKFGFEVHVLTVLPGWARFLREDHSLLEQIPSDVKVHRTPILDAMSVLQLLKKDGNGSFNAVNNEGRIAKLINNIRSNFFIPDAKRGWNYFAKKKALKIIDKHSINYLVTTSPPHSTQLIGQWLKRRRGLKWIADFRDPWNGIFYESEFRYSNRTKKTLLKMESTIIRDADMVTTVGNNLSKYLSNLNKVDINKFFALFNGFDQELFEEKELLKNSEEFVITYAGTLTDSYRADVLFESLSELIPYSKKNIELKFAGTVNQEVINTVESNSQLSTVTEFLGVLDHDKSLKLIKQSDLLLLIIPEVDNSELILTGKLFEYIAAKVPILCIGPKQGEAASVISECNAGKTFSRDEKKSIIDFINRIINEEQTEIESGNTDQYSRENQVKKFVEKIGSHNN